MVCYNKTNPKLLPVIFLFSHYQGHRSKVKVVKTGQGGKNNDPVTDDFTLFLQKLITKLGSFLFITKDCNLLELE